MSTFRIAKDRIGFDRKWAKYAGMSAVALFGSEASGGIVHVRLGEGSALNGLAVDLDLDGREDFVFDGTFFSRTFGCTTTTSTTYGARHCETWAGNSRGYNLTAFGRNGNRLVTRTTEAAAARAFTAGELITPSAPSRSSALLAGSYSRHDAHCETGCSGNSGEFASTGRAFLGLVFHDQTGQQHAGWLEVNAIQFDPLAYGYAYETTPGAPIAAGAVPEPPTLVLLAAGAAGLAVWRSKRANYEQS